MPSRGFIPPVPENKVRQATSQLETARKLMYTCSDALQSLYLCSPVFMAPLYAEYGACTIGPTCRYFLRNGPDLENYLQLPSCRRPGPSSELPFKTVGVPPTIL